MDLRSSLRSIRRSWWLIVLTMLAAAGAAMVASTLSPRLYASSVTFYVSAPSQDVTDSYTGDLLSQQRVRSYAVLLTSERLADAVAAVPGVDVTPAQVRAMVSAQAVPQTVLLTATVTDRDPARAARVCTALAAQFSQLVTTLETPPGGHGATVKVAVTAGPGLTPGQVSPRPVRNLGIGLLVGLLLGFAGAVARDVLDVTIKSVDALAAATGAPVLGFVPYDSAARRSPITTDADARSGRAESFRHLRTNLRYTDVDRPPQIIAVTSAVPEEGKSTTAVNLAVTMATAGAQVLLLDADLRRPRVAEYLGIEGAVGLSNVLAGEASLTDVVQSWGRHNLHVLPSGFSPPNPSELLGSRTMATLLAQFRDRYDVVIVDTPPMLPVTDAAVVAARADGTVLVVRCGRTPQARVRAALAGLSAVDARVLGCVLSMLPTRSRGGGYYYAYAYREESRKTRFGRRAIVGSAGPGERTPSVALGPPGPGGPGITGEPGVVGGSGVTTAGAHAARQPATATNPGGPR